MLQNNNKQRKNKTKFQRRVINMSYRKRGKELRINIKRQKKTHKMIKEEEKKIQLIRKEEKIIIPYSPRNIKTKTTLESSILKPEINSLSPSTKSKGARLHSINNKKNIKKISKK